VKLNWKNLSVAAVAAALVLAAAALAFSQGPQGPPPGPPGGGFRGGPGPQGPPPGPGGPFRGGPGPRDGLGPMGRDLNLTDDQRAQIKKITDSFDESNKALFDQMRALHKSEPEPGSGTFDEAAVRTAAEARAKIQVELDVSHARMMSQIAGVLTAEQKAQLAARRQQFERQGPPPPPPPRPDQF
jgi:Spy/CpxP family protein refolding chaperone